MGTFTGVPSLNDVITPTEVSAGVTKVGGPAPSTANDAIFGLGGNDTLDGGGGADTLDGGDGDDQLRWTVGGASDVIDGGAGAFDLLLVTGDAGRGESYVFSDVGGHVSMQGPSGAVLNIDNVEALVLNTLNGTDSVTVNNLSGTDLQGLTVDLGVNGVGDGVADKVTLNGGDGGVDLFYLRDARVVSNYPSQPTHPIPGILLSGLDAIDRVSINGGSGNDHLGDFDTTPFPNTPPLQTDTFPGQIVPRLILDGGAGNDEIFGLDGATLIGGLGADTLTLGAGTVVGEGGEGDDVFHRAVFAPAHQLIKGDAGYDRLVTSFERGTISLSSEGRVVIAEVGGGVTTLENVEHIEGGLFRTTEPAQLLIGDLSTTAVQRLVVNFNLNETVPQSVVMTGGNQANHLIVEATTGNVGGTFGPVVGVFGLTAARTGSEPNDIEVRLADTNDAVIVDGGGGADLIELRSNGYLSTLEVHGGAGNDTLLGSHIDNDGHFLFGDYGNDSIDAGGSGNISGGVGNDTLVSAGGDNFIFNAGESGSDVVVGFHRHGAPGELDKIVLNGASDFSFEQAVASHHIFQSGADVVVNEGVGLTFTLRDMSLANLDGRDFFFN